MKKRSITDDEISLIKAMQKRGMKNKNIQFFFNRPDKPVNSGRITGIKNGSYSNSLDISAAEEKALSSFIEHFEKIDDATENVTNIDDNPMTNDVENIESFFAKDQNGIWRFKLGESDIHECKESFGLKHSGKWLKAIGALSNNRGGFVLFGVKDKSENKDENFKVVGLNSNEFQNADPADFSKIIRAVFDPTPRFETKVVEIGGMEIGVIIVHQHPSRPIIATKPDGSAIKEGDILFRYPGQSARIKYSDLRAILDERDQKSRQDILPMVQKLLEIGPRDAMVADLKQGVVSDSDRSILIGEELLERIKFIKEGEFDEKAGAETLRLVGDVQSVDGLTQIVRRGFITSSDIIKDFINQKTSSDPKEYIRCAVQSGNGAWLPIHYFASIAEISRSDLISFINSLEASKNYKATFSKRAGMKVSAFSAAGGRSAEILELIIKGLDVEVKDIKDASNTARAYAGLKEKTKSPLPGHLKKLNECREIIENSDKQSWMSPVRRALCRLDELYFAAS